VISEGEEPQKVLDYMPGDYFGELSLLKNEPRAAYVVAKTNSKVAEIDRKTFKRIVGPLENILRRNIQRYIHYC